MNGDENKKNYSHQNGTRSDLYTPHLEDWANMRHKKFGKLKRTTLNDPEEVKVVAQSFSKPKPIEIKKESTDNEEIKSEPETDEEISKGLAPCQIGIPLRPPIAETGPLVKGVTHKINIVAQQQPPKISRPWDSNTGSNGAFKPVVPAVVRPTHPPPHTAVFRDVRDVESTKPITFPIGGKLPGGASLDPVPLTEFRIPSLPARAHLIPTVAHINHPLNPFLHPAASASAIDRFRLLHPHHAGAHPSSLITSQAHIHHLQLQQQLARAAQFDAQQQHSHGGPPTHAHAHTPHSHAHSHPGRPPLQLTLPPEIHLERMDTTKQEPLSPESDIAASHSPSLSSPLSNDGSEGSKSGTGTRRKKKDEIVPWWVKVESIEDFKRHAENYCEDEQQMKDMVELRRKIKNRDAAQRSRLKRMKSTDDLKQENKYLRKEFGNSKTELDRNHQIKQETIRRIDELERRKIKIARALKHMSAAKMKNRTTQPPA